MTRGKISVLPHKQYLKAIEEDDAVLVAGYNSYFPDDIEGKCECGKKIFFRPYNKKAKRIVCIACGYKLAEAELTKK